ncbi:MAG: hypothetical protein GYB66_13255 [Chloroflexi bacterium]|nr:hypothetical protein [Chloroflexota bacterium]
MQPGIVATYVRPLGPDQQNFLIARNPGSVPQKYCMVPAEVLDSVPDARLQVFIEPPPEPEDAKRAYQYALSPSINYAILPQFACTPETIAGGLPDIADTPGDWEVNPGSAHPYRTAAIYCRANGAIEVYAIVNGNGVPAFTATPEEIAAVGVPLANTLIKEGGGGIRLYRLSSGEFQVNAPMGSDPNGYVVIWDGC